MSEASIGYSPEVLILKCLKKFLIHSQGLFNFILDEHKVTGLCLEKQWHGDCHEFSFLVPGYFYMKANISLKLDLPQSSSLLAMTLFFGEFLCMTPKIALQRSYTVSIVLILIVYKLSFYSVLLKLLVLFCFQTRPQGLNKIYCSLSTLFKKNNWGQDLMANS